MCMTKPLTLTTAIRTIIAVAGIATLRRAQGPIASNMNIMSTNTVGVAMNITGTVVASREMYTR